VSLVPSFSGILLALDAGERIVGRTDFDTAAVLSQLPSVGNGLQPSVETIVSLRPDVVLAFGGASDPDTRRRLNELGIPVVGLAADGIEEVLEVVRSLGVLVHREAVADSLIRETRRELEEVRTRTASRPRVRAILLIGGTPPWVAGPGSYMDQLLDIAGGENVFGDLDSAFGPVSPELLATRPFDLVLAGPRTELPPGLAGAPRGELPPGIEIPGPGMAESARALAGILHPDLPW
jgi:iron complex transport system substrate-binding protein